MSFTKWAERPLLLAISQDITQIIGIHSAVTMTKSKSKIRMEIMTQSSLVHFWENSRNNKNNNIIINTHFQ